MKKLLLILALIGAVCTAPAQLLTVNVGSAANDGTGDTLRAAMQKLNSNDVWLDLVIGTNSTNIAAANTLSLAISNFFSTNVTAAVSNYVAANPPTSFSNATFYGQSTWTNNTTDVGLLVYGAATLMEFWDTNGVRQVKIWKPGASEAGGYNGKVMAYEFESTGPVKTPDLQATSITVGGITLNTVLTNLFNIEKFTSEEYPISNGVVVNTNHSLIATPQVVRWSLICKTNDAGFEVGDEVDIAAFYGSALGSSVLAYGVNTTNLFLSCEDNTDIAVRNKTNGVRTDIAESQWKVKATALLIY